MINFDSLAFEGRSGVDLELEMEMGISFGDALRESEKLPDESKLILVASLVSYTSSSSS